MIPKRIVKLVLERDGQVCQLNLSGCAYVATVADHRSNRGAGGSTVLNDPACLIAACGLCNGRKEDANRVERELLEWRGIRVQKAATNDATLLRCLATAVRYRNGDWYQLDSDGGRRYLREVK